MKRHTIESIMETAGKHYFWSRVDKTGGPAACWPWLGGVDRHGYGYEGRYRSHRAAWELFNRESLAQGRVVMHSCDNPLCCNPLHLSAASQAENNADRARKDRGAKGEANGRAVVTEEMVYQIRAATGSNAEIGQRFGLNKWTVREIRARRNWAWLPERDSQFGNFDAS